MPLKCTLDTHSQAGDSVNICALLQVTPRMIEVILEPWPNAVGMRDESGNTCMHHLCSNRAVTCKLIKVLLDYMTKLAESKVATGVKVSFFYFISLTTCPTVDDLPYRRHLDASLPPLFRSYCTQLCCMTLSLPPSLPLSFSFLTSLSHPFPITLLP